VEFFLCEAEYLSSWLANPSDELAGNSR
jgi:hypothetical protein